MACAEKAKCRKCCCDACNEEKIACHPCCKCVPRALCATFTPDSEYMECDEGSVFVERTGTASYVGSIAGFDFTLSLEYDEYYGECYWLFVSEAADVEERFNFEPGERDCKAPEISVEVAGYDCSGTITFNRHERKTVKYVDGPGGCKEFYCGRCRCACKTLCVFLEEGGYAGEEEWEWDGGGWGRARLVKDEYTGECLIEIDGYDPIEIDTCGDELSFTVEDAYTGDYITGSCKKCECQSGLDFCCFEPKSAPETLFVTAFCHDEEHPSNPAIAITSFAISFVRTTDECQSRHTGQYTGVFSAKLSPSLAGEPIPCVNSLETFTEEYPARICLDCDLGETMRFYVYLATSFGNPRVIPCCNGFGPNGEQPDSTPENNTYVAGATLEPSTCADLPSVPNSEVSDFACCDPLILYTYIPPWVTVSLIITE